MCRDHIHSCKLCGHEYDCVEPNWLCPTLNFDTDSSLCSECKQRLINELEQEINDDSQAIDRRVK